MRRFGCEVYVNKSVVVTVKFAPMDNLCATLDHRCARVQAPEGGHKLWVPGGVIKKFSRGVSGGVGNEKPDDLFFRKARILRTKRTQNFTSVLSNPNFTSMPKHPITKCVHAARKKFLFHRIAEKKLVAR